MSVIATIFLVARCSYRLVEKYTNQRIRSKKLYRCAKICFVYKYKSFGDLYIRFEIHFVFDILYVPILKKKVSQILTRNQYKKANKEIKINKNCTNQIMTLFNPIISTELTILMALSSSFGLHLSKLHLTGNSSLVQFFFMNSKCQSYTLAGKSTLRSHISSCFGLSITPNVLNSNMCF